MSTTYRTPWLHLSPGEEGPQLVCVPYSAKGASQFSGWPELLEHRTALAAVQLPAREERLTEQPIARIDELLAGLVPALLPWIDRSFVLFGHCMGALIAAELATALRRDHDLEPAALVLSGAIPAWQDTSRFDLSDLTDAELIRNLRGSGALQPRMLAEPALLTFMLPATRADSALCDDIRGRGRPDSPALSCPLVLCAGRDDSRFEPKSMLGWQALTTGKADLRIFDGDHTFLDAGPAAVAAVVREVLTA
ncbi:alpha/beta fold hydrolase [Kribbella sp. NPDC056861]|uniref:thioesterase II family protein n=1 Tax=Kribbella sp. NPDC056861 TaxID=3154857 RepID=UPI003447284D